MPRPLLAFCLLVALLLAGCAGPTGPPVDPRTVPETAPAEAGDGNYNLTLRVEEAGVEEPIENAAVIVYWSDDEESDDGVRISGSGEAGPEGGSFEGVVRVPNPSTPPPDETLSMRTDASGQATARTPENRVVGIVAWAPDYTEEWIPEAVTGEQGTGGPVGFELYQARIVETREGEIGPAGASPGRISNSNYDWYPQQAPWGEDNETHAGYVERLASLRVNLNWTNGPDSGGGGDLSIGIGESSSDPDYVQESDNPQTAPGQQTEEASLSIDDIEEHEWPSSDRLYVGPATSTAYAAPMGMTYGMTTETQFSPFAFSNDVYEGENDSPGPGLALALVAVAGVALALRRRQED